MGPIRTALVVVIVTALGVLSCYALPGWIGVSAGGVLLACALAATLAALLGRGTGERATRLWKEFCNSLYGL